MENYGKIISSLRKEKGLTQNDLGKELNVTYQAVSKWENDLIPSRFRNYCADVQNFRHNGGRVHKACFW